MITTTYHIWDGTNIVMDNNVFEFADSEGFESLLKYYRGIHLIRNGSSYYIYDIYGNIVATSSASGTVNSEKEYNAFGVTEMSYEPFGYRGEYTDYETGYVYLRNRYYNPETGRFITEDPIRDGLNWYAYCNNNPIMFVDPWGLAITDEDIEAYKNGNMSNYYWKMLNEANNMWNNAKSDDYNTKAVAHYRASIARQSYGNYVDDFDYTFGTGYLAIDNGDPGKYVKVAYGYSSTGSYSGTVFLYYERYIENGKNYIKIIKSNGYGSGSTRGRIYVSGIKYTYGASTTFGGRSNTQTTSDSQYNITFSNLPEVPDDKGVYHVTGINATFQFTNTQNMKYYITVVNNVYESWSVDEKGDMISNRADEFDVLIEALQRGER